MKIAAGEDRLTPKLFTALRSYSPKLFTCDLIAGVTVGLVALPLAMAFAIASGVPPQAGIYCAIVAGFLISALGGSMTQIGGPTGAFVVVVAGIVQKHGMDGLFMCTLMAGVFLVLLGITGLGSAIKFIPRPVVIGFTNGIAVLIASTQMKDFFGLRVESVPGEFLGRMRVIGENFHTFSATTLLFSTSALVVILLMLKFVKRVPGTIVVLFAGTVIAWLFHVPLENIQDRFGDIPSGFPQLHVPTIRFDLILPLLSSAFTVTMLGAIESLLSAVVADRMSGDRHNPNAELIGQGFANIASPLFGGLPATGAIARTATNIRSGAKTPVAGMIHALTLLAILLFAAPLAKHIPMCILAATLLVVAYNMGEWREVPQILKLTRADISIWFITFLLTVLADLTVAVEAGMILAVLLFIRKVTATTSVARVTSEYIAEGMKHSLQTNALPEDVVVYRIHGPFLFGATDKLSIIHEDLPTLPKIVMLRLRNMTAIDATGLHALEALADDLKKSGRILMLCGVRQQPLKLMQQAEFYRHIGAENILPDLRAGIERAQAVLAQK
ncbi:MAG: SulP family inorganic anion transporter [Fimbriimonadales bacterium]